MINQKVKYILLICITFLAFKSLALTVSERVHTHLQEVNVSKSTVTINDKVYTYDLNKPISSYRESIIEPESIRSLVKDRIYYFEILQGHDGKEIHEDNQNTIIFISEEKLPE
jgi:hypothetical protein